MTYQLRHPNGGLIAATVELADRRVTLHSRGGATGGRPERNPEYSAAFDAIIDRLSPQARVISRVLLDSRRAHASGAEVVLATAEDFANLPLDEVKRLIRRSARAFGRAKGATPNQGNSTKQLRFDVSLELPELALRLSATKSLVGQGLDGRDDENGPSGEGETSIPPSDNDRSWAEGDKKKVAHLRRERASGLAARKKSDFIERNGKLACERCGLIPSETLGSNGEAVIEVHHKWPLSEAQTDTRTRLEDLSCLCANCHRITHREMGVNSIGKRPKTIRRQT
jgi:hypothetical protein